MNEFEMPSIELIDRLVDGELTESERREVLETLEREECSESCGWRRLALAYVEAQSLRHEMKTLMRPVTEIQPVQRTSPSTIGHLGQIAILACSCLIAFGLGQISMPARHDIAEVTKQQSELNETELESQLIPGDEFAAIASAVDSDEVTQETLRLELDDLEEGVTRTATVPVFSGSRSDLAQYLSGPPSVPLDFQQQLLREGQIVSENRQLVEVELPDGRLGLIPICDVTVTKADADAFQ